MECPTCSGFQGRILAECASVLLSSEGVLRSNVLAFLCFSEGRWPSVLVSETFRLPGEESGRLSHCLSVLGLPADYTCQVSY